MRMWLFLILSSNWVTGQDLKIGLVDTDSIFYQSKEGAAIRKSGTKLVHYATAELIEPAQLTQSYFYKEVVKMVMRSCFPSPELGKLQDSLVLMQEDLKRLVTQLDSVLTAYEEEALELYHQALTTTAQRVAEQLQYDLILQGSVNLEWLAPRDHHLEQAILQELQKQQLPLKDLYTTYKASMLALKPQWVTKGVVNRWLLEQQVLLQLMGAW